MAATKQTNQTKQEQHADLVESMSGSLINRFKDIEAFNDVIGPITLSPGFVRQLNGLQQFRQDVLSEMKKAFPEKRFYLGETSYEADGYFFDTITIRWVK